MAILKHVDHEVDRWGEFQGSPKGTGHNFRPHRMRGVSFRPIPFRPFADDEVGQSFRVPSFRSKLFRPMYFRPEAGSGPATLSQSAGASFPDRRGTLGLGLRVSNFAGSGGQYLEHDLGQSYSSINTRFMINPATFLGGSLTILLGLQSTGQESFRVVYESATRQLRLVLDTGDLLATNLSQELPWHCIEIKSNVDAGEAALWLNGVSVGTISRPPGSQATRKLWIGGVFKDSTATGELYIDEWIISDEYIGPVTVDAKSLYADDPTRWLVIYNTTDLESIAWAENYRQSRGVPFANLVGWSLSTSEVIDLTQWLSLYDSINDYLVNNRLDNQVLGILIGYRVPGYVDLNGSGFIEAVPALLHHTETTPLFNPLSKEGPPTRPTKTNLNGFHLTARIDGPTLGDAQAMVLRSTALMDHGVGNGSSSTMWIDPYTTPGSETDPHIASMVSWASSLNRMRTRLPLKVSAEINPQQEVQFNQIQDDGFFWGWSATTPSPGFFGTPGGDRVFCLQLSTTASTGPSLRGAALGHWLDTAVDAGYAAVASSSRSYSTSAIPLIQPFFDALREGWTLSEAWFVANPVPGEGLFLTGDPLLTLAMPRAGWDIFGPVNQLEEIDPNKPSLALREDEFGVALQNALHPPANDRGLYLIRRIDPLGRSEVGTRVVQAVNIEGVAQQPPLMPVWPDTENWPLSMEDGMVSLCLMWGRPIQDCRIQTVELEAQVPGDNAIQVLQELAPKRTDINVKLLQPLPNQPTRYRWRIYSSKTNWIRTSWSEIITPLTPQSVALQLIEVRG